MTVIIHPAAIKALQEGAVRAVNSAGNQQDRAIMERDGWPMCEGCKAFMHPRWSACEQCGRIVSRLKPRYSRYYSSRGRWIWRCAGGGYAGYDSQEIIAFNDWEARVWRDALDLKPNYPPPPPNRYYPKGPS